MNKLTLTQFTAKVNALQKDKIDKLYANPARKPLFGCSCPVHSEAALASYHDEGLTPAQTLRAMAAGAY